MAVDDGSGDDEATFVDALARAKRGDGHGFDWLYRTYNRRVSAVVRSEASPNHDAVVNAVFVRVFRSIDRFVGGRAAFASFVYQIVRFQVIDERRAHRRRLPADDDLDWHDLGNGTDHPATGGDATARIHEALQALTPEQREVIVLRVFFGLTGPEAAEALDRPIEAVRSLQQRAEARLRNLLESGMVAR